MLVILSQKLNPPSPTWVTLSGRVMLVTWRQAKKALSPMWVTGRSSMAAGTATSPVASSGKSVMTTDWPPGATSYGELAELRCPGGGGRERERATEGEDRGGGESDRTPAP